jgi:glycosyltransferase involved in cell wall biosynthesis
MSTPIPASTPADRDGQPRVAVIVICYNLEEYIGDCIRSVVGQTARNLQIVVVDDGSTDASWPIIRELAAEDPRIVAVRQANSGRPAGARNAGLRVADGEYVCFLDGDDLYEPEKIERELRMFASHPELDVVFHDMHLVGRDGKARGSLYLRDVDYVRQAGPALVPSGTDCYLGTPGFYRFMTTRITGIHTSTIMVRRSAIEAEGGAFSCEPDIDLADDIDMWFRLARRRNVGYVDLPLSSYRQHSGGLTNDPPRVLAAGIAAHTRNFARAIPHLDRQDMALCRARLGRQYCYLGNALARAGRRREARACYRKAFRLDPGLRPPLLWVKALVPRSRRVSYVVEGLRRRARRRASG